MKLILRAFLALSLLGLAGCAALDQQGSEAEESFDPPGGVPEGKRIKLSDPETMPVIGKANRPIPPAPPPAWLVVDGEAAQASYGRTCEEDACNGREPQKQANNLATMEVPNGEKVLVVVGSNESIELSAGVVGWENVPEGPTPGIAFTEDGNPSESVVPFFMRELDTNPVSEEETPAIEVMSGGEVEQPSGFTVFELASTGNPGDRLLSVYARPPGEPTRPGPEEQTAYHWRLEPGQPGENLPPEEEGLPRVVKLERGPATPEYSPEEAAERASLRNVAEEASFGPAGKREDAGEGYLWALEEPEVGPRGGSGDSKGALKGGPKEVGKKGKTDGKTEGKAGPPPARALLKLDPDTRKVLSTIDEPGFGITLDVGAGAVWVAGNPEGGPAGDQNVARVDPETEAVEAIRIGGRANEIIATEEDGVWVAVGANPLDPKVVRLDPETGEVISEIETLGLVTSIAVDEYTGDVWVGVQDRLPLEPGEVVLIDPETNEISGRFEVESGAAGVLAASGGTAWVRGPGLDGRFFEIDPRSEAIKSTFVK